MELTTIDILRRGMDHALLTDEQVAQALENIRAGKAISPDGVSFEDRRQAQTEAWRWRHELARRGNVLVSDLRSATFTTDNGATYRFGIYSISKAMSTGHEPQAVPVTEVRTAP